MAQDPEEMMVTYRTDAAIKPDQFIDVLRRSSLAERRPVDDRACIEQRLQHANLLVTAWNGDLLVGVARSVTDFSFCCYLSDLAVDRACQRRGIGRELIRNTQAQLGPNCTLILLSAPAAMDYYPHIGFERHPGAGIQQRNQDIRQAECRAHPGATSSPQPGGTMNKQFIISGIVTSVVALLLGGIVHAGLLNSEYAKLPNLMRTMEDSQNYFHYIIIAHLIIGFALTWIYRQGMNPAKPVVAQGMRFGFAIACVMVIPIYLIYYAVQPMPESLVIKQIIFDTIGTVILGIVVAYLNRPPKAA